VTVPPWKSGDNALPATLSLPQRVHLQYNFRAPAAEIVAGANALVPTNT